MKQPLIVQAVSLVLGLLAMSLVLATGPGGMDQENLSWARFFAACAAFGALVVGGPLINLIIFIRKSRH